MPAPGPDPQTPAYGEVRAGCAQGVLSSRTEQARRKTIAGAVSGSAIAAGDEDRR